ncbi:hypothetical protein ACFT7S_06350 [Streptomyces sp. NPDC057136]|uniref:hypothetical protein n=1 Tax=Streptomyces sp. NPDC057136 TaxID=3346029 RepID=UPI003643605F
MRTLELSSPGSLRDELNALVLAGGKTATATLLAEYVDEAEGEGYTDLAHWRRAHIDYWQNLEGRSVDDTTPVVCMHFTRAI